MTDPANVSADSPYRSIAVLFSGGLDSAAFLAETIAAYHETWPLYVRCGFAWERAERHHARAFLAAIKTQSLQSLQTIRVPMRDLLADHWSVTGKSVPDAQTPDEAVYLPGRNVLLLGKAMIWCHLRNVPLLALGTLRANPFPDATEGFLNDFQSAVNQAINGKVRVVQPYAQMAKRNVASLSRGFPHELTFSCINPVGLTHCGRCNKCAERRVAFREAGITDRTVYDDVRGGL